MFKSLLILSGGLIAGLSAQEATLTKTSKVLSPAKVSERVQTQLKQSRKSCVSLSSGGYASGVIISPNGYILTAGHVLKSAARHKKSFHVELDDGRKFEAQALGFNVEADIGLLKIVNGKGTQFPFSPMAKTTAPIGDFVFTFAHPSGKLKGRPAQVRMGRVHSINVVDGTPISLFSDLNIQPGDSGGPLFNLKGEIVAIDSSAAGLLNFNIFSPIDQFHKDEARYKTKTSWGNKDNAPMSKSRYTVESSAELISKIQKELNIRYSSKHIPTYDFVNSKIKSKGVAELHPQDIINFMIKDAIAIHRGSDVGMGLDDPAIVQQLPGKPKHFHSLKITDGTKQLCRAIALDQNHLLCKASEIKGQKQLALKLPKETHPLSLVHSSKELDLAILKLKSPLKLPPIIFPQRTIDIKPAQALFAPDYHGRPLWNIATDERRIVSKKRSLGPLKNKNVISKVRAPFPIAIRHSLPLYAEHAGTPVFDLHGNFIGIHIARFSRTMGLILPHETIKKFYDNFKKSKQQ